MFHPPINSKKGIAALLLALFGFILTEKNAHEHQQTAADISKQGQGSWQKGSSCIICDFQLSAGAELPFQPELQLAVDPGIQFTAYTSSFYLQTSPSCLCERGPPSLC